MRSLIVLPKVGQVIYVPTTIYCDHGIDDRIGGRATVVAVEGRISGGDIAPFVQVEGFPGTWMNWIMLAEEQEILERQFGDQWAYADPDTDPQSNLP